jgi:hypothetical protein
VDTTYARYLNACGKMRRAPDLGLGSVEALENLALVCRESNEDLGPLTAHAHEANRGLGISLHDMLEDDVHCVGLGFESRWLVISIPTAFAVVHDNHHRLQNHLGGENGGFWDKEFWKRTK